MSSRRSSYLVQYTLFDNPLLQVIPWNKVGSWLKIDFSNSGEFLSNPDPTDESFSSLKNNTIHWIQQNKEQIFVSITQLVQSKIQGVLKSFKNQKYYFNPIQKFSRRFPKHPHKLLCKSCIPTGKQALGCFFQLVIMKQGLIVSSRWCRGRQRKLW